MYPAVAIANYFLELAKKEHKDIDPLKLQKLVFIAHGWHLGIHEAPLVKERVEAWEWGPVIPSVYHAFKHFGRRPVTEPGEDAEWNPLGSIEPIVPKVEESDRKTTDFLSEVWKIYGKYSGIQLSNLTHEKESPWDKVRRANEDHRWLVIGDDIIQKYYRELSVA